MSLSVKAGLISMLLVCAGQARAEYCLDWSSFVAKHSGSSGHCWATERECDTYRISRPAGDYVGGCQYRPGQYPPTGAQKGGAKVDGAARAAAELKKRSDAAKRQQAESERQSFEKDRQQLLGTLKGNTASEPARTILLKPIPPTGGHARSQLDCVSRNTPGASREKQAADCTPVTPAVPEPPGPTAVETPHEQRMKQ